MKEKVRHLLEEVVPLAYLDSDFLFAELDSLGVTAILMSLSSAFGIELDASYATPRHLRNLDSIVAMVEESLNTKHSTPTE